RAFTKSIESHYISEGGIEDAVYRIAAGKQIGSSETLTVGSGVATILVTTIGNQKTVRSEGKKGNIQQNLETQIEVASAPPPSVSFNYGAQVGSGGVEMSQNSEIQGSVYSNGRIVGPSSSSNAKITGNASAAGASAIENIIITGSAQANAIDGSVISGDATSTVSISGTVAERGYANSVDNSVLNKDSFSDTLVSSVVNGKCYYQTQVDSVCILGEFPNTPFTPASNLPALALPISDAQINQWKTDAAAGGTISGNYSVDSNISLGPKKITGDLLMTANNKTLTVTGTIYVQGNIDISNGSSIKCAVSYGAQSCVVLSDGWIHLSNNGTFSGSGTAGSFLMLLSLAAGSGHHGSAIDIHNNASGVIFYAGNGMVYLHNNVTVTDLVANKIHLENGAKIIYDTLLQNTNFGGGGGGGGGGSADVKYWREVE
ncbi:MAG: hypothetical protein HYW91_00810, partial [Candidatus Sungbacteria bacterium]|nr:hypothetical protein [Candidatus Sungbacteria bacterium]